MEEHVYHNHHHHYNHHNYHQVGGAVSWRSASLFPPIITCCALPVLIVMKVVNIIITISIIITIIITIFMLTRSQKELPARRMADSLDSAAIPLGSDPQLRDRFRLRIN